MEILFFLAAYFSEIIGTMAGFGSSTVFLPLALVFFDFKTALVLVALLHIFGNISRFSFFRRGLHAHMLISFGIPSVIFTIIGALSVSYLSQTILKGLLGIFLAAYALIFLVKEKLKIKSTLTNSIIGGGLSGFLAGLIGTGGALRGAFLTAFGLPKESYIATAAVIALMVDMTRIPIYFASGFLDNKHFWYIPLLFLMAIAGSYTGKNIVSHMSQKLFRKIVLLGVLAIGIKFVYDWLL